MQNKFLIRQWLLRTMTTLPARSRLASRDALAASMACALSWYLSQQIFGHQHPTFAVVTAVVCLAPGVPSHLKQTTNLLIGCTLGIALGELLWQIPDAHPLARLAIGIFTSVLLGSAIGPVPMVPIQSGVSMILVLAMGPSSAGGTRMLDVLMGASVGLLFSQVLFTSDPLKDMERASKVFLKQISNGLDLVVKSCETMDAKATENAMGQLAIASDSLSALRAAVNEAESSRRWSVRGRLINSRLAFVCRRYDRHALRVYATSLLLAESMSRATSHMHSPPPEFVAGYTRWIVDCCNQLANNPSIVALSTRTPLATIPKLPLKLKEMIAMHNSDPTEWTQVSNNAYQLEQSIRALIASRDK